MRKWMGLSTSVSNADLGLPNSCWEGLCLKKIVDNVNIIKNKKINMQQKPKVFAFCGYGTNPKIM